MKKIWKTTLSVLLVLLLLLGLVGCGGGDTSDVDSQLSGGDVSTDDGGNTDQGDNSDTDSSEDAGDKDNTSTTAGAGDKKTTVKKTTSTKKKTDTGKEDNKDSGKTPATGKEKVMSEFQISTCMAVYEAAWDDYASVKKVVQVQKDAGIDRIQITNVHLPVGKMVADACEELGVDFFWQEYHSSDTKFSHGGDMDYEVTDSTIKAVTEKMKDYEYCRGYYLWDEVAETRFSLCKSLKDKLEKNDPDRMAYTNLLPSYGPYKWNGSPDSQTDHDFVRYVDKYLEVVDPDVICFDHYADTVLRDDVNTLMGNSLWRDMGLLRDRSLKTGKPFWWIFSAADLPEANRRARWSAQMFAGLAYNVKCLEYWYTYNEFCDGVGNKKSQFEIGKQLNKEVKNIGNFLFDQEPKELYQFGITEKQRKMFFLDDVKESDLIKNAPKNTIVSVFEQKDGKKTVMVVNMLHKSSVKGNLELKVKSNFAAFVKETGKITGKTKGVTEIPVALGAGECAVFVID